MTTFSNTWNDAYEALPTDDNYGYEIDDYIRQTRLDVRERMEVDHSWKDGVNDGKHSKLTLPEQSSEPDNVANTGFLYTKESANGKTELYFKNEDGDIIQLTEGGYVYPFPSGTKMYFYQNVAPVGWTIDSACADALLAVKGGSQAYNVNGGNQAGTWTQPDHTLTVAEMPEHHHSLQSDDQYSSDAVGMGYSNAGNGVAGCDRTEIGGFYEFDYADHQLVMDTGGSGAHNHGTTYRPLAQVGIIATKN